MSLDFLKGCSFIGPALPVPFVQFELERELSQRDLLPGRTGPEDRALQEAWESYRRRLRELVSTGGPARVWNHVLEPLKERLGYATIERQSEVETREGREDGGYLIQTTSGDACLRAWSTEFDADLDAPARRGHAYRYSPVRCAIRVLLAKNERLGVITNGTELRLLIPDQARVDSQVIVSLDPEWRRSRSAPDSYRLLLALASPAGLTALPDIIDKARLKQSKVTKDLRLQARVSIERFIQELLDNPGNQALLDQYPNKAQLARSLWHEGLILVYRILFILKLEAFDDPARAFGFASTSLWRNTYSPTTCLADIARRVLAEGMETGSFLEQGLRTLFTMFAGGVTSTELNIHALDGALFGSETIPIISGLHWGERACASILDCLLWTPRQRGSGARERVHYGPLDVEDLGRVYEALLELEPGIATEPMCRLRRQKLEVVVPVAQGEQYRPMDAAPEAAANLGEEEDFQDETDADDTDEAEATTGRSTRIEWIEDILTGRFYLRVGIGRKATGSYYTPHSFVKFLVQETLSPQVETCSPKEDPNPSGILSLKVLDPAMGSGHFLVGACRYLGEVLYEACRLCDEKALECEQNADLPALAAERPALLEQATVWRARIEELPVTNNEIMRYLPSHAPEGEESGLSQRKALALCRRLVTVHCLYGVDKNPLAVELAKLSLWIESHAEGMPLTFLDHRLVVGDSLTGPFFKDLLKYPGLQEPLDDLFNQGLQESFKRAMEDALQYVKELESSVGVSVSDVQAKQEVKAKLDQALLPFKIAAASWAGGVMLGKDKCNDSAYNGLIKSICEHETGSSITFDFDITTMLYRSLKMNEELNLKDKLNSYIGATSLVMPLSYDLTFPEVFYPSCQVDGMVGFNAVIGNPPWEGIDTSNKEFYVAFDLNILDLKTDSDINSFIERLMANPVIKKERISYDEQVEDIKAISRRLLSYINRGVNRASAATPDLYQCFAERSSQFVCKGGMIGLVLPSAFHANEGATGIRHLYIENMNLSYCLSFINRKHIFEIHPSKKFAIVIALNKPIDKTSYFTCAFYLQDDKWLFTDNKNPKPLKYDYDFVMSTTGNALNLLELSDPSDVEPIKVAYAACQITFGELRRSWGILPTEELHRGKQKWRFILTSDILNHNEDPRQCDIKTKLLMMGYLSIIEGKTFHQYTNTWDDRPDFLVHIKMLKDKLKRLKQAETFRLTFRKIASSTNERTGIFTMLPPGVLCTDSALVESTALNRTTINALTVCGLANSFTFDWLLRQMVDTNVQFSFLDLVPVPNINHLRAILAHNALRLLCNHDDYTALWHEQLDQTWQESKPPFTWPVLVGEDERWAVRAEIDAVVAQAYGLNRKQYAHVLSAFSHRSYPKAPDLCLAMFDELQEIGRDAFTKKYDPYWDIPLNENLPRPAIKLPVLAEGIHSGSDSKPTFVQQSLLGTIVQGSLFETYVPQAQRRGKKHKG